MMYSFDDKLAFSRGVREQSDLATIKKILAGCTQIVKSNEDVDRAGIDYVATLRGKAEVFIDGKARKPGCSRFWMNGEPELSLEKWSVMPGGKYHTPSSRCKTGWTLNEKNNVDLIYFSFDPRDSEQVFLIGFQPLRLAFRFHLPMWEERYGLKVQESEWNAQCPSDPWQSACVIVPASVVQEAIKVVSQNVTRDADGMPLFRPNTDPPPESLYA